MQVSVRSYLSAGTVAVVGAGAIALAPPIQTPVPVMAAPVVADVSLTGLSLSLDQIVGVLTRLGLGEAISPIVNLLPSNLISSFVTEFSDQALALLAMAAKGIVTGVGSAVMSLVLGPDSIVPTVVAAIGGIPKAVVDAVRALGSDGLSAAVQTLAAGVAAPLTGVVRVIVDAANALRVDVQHQIGDLVVALPSLLVNVLQAVVVQDFQAVVDMVKNTVSGIAPLIGKLRQFAGIGGATAVSAGAAAVSAGAAAVSAGATAGAAASAPRASAVAVLPISEVPPSAAVGTRRASRVARVLLRANGESAVPSPAAAAPAGSVHSGAARGVVPAHSPALAGRSGQPTNSSHEKPPLN